MVPSLISRKLDVGQEAAMAHQRLRDRCNTHTRFDDGIPGRRFLLLRPAVVAYAWYGS